MNNWYLYILRCESNKLYIGISQNPSKRFKTHQNKQGPKFTQKFRPIEIVYIEKYENLSLARKREIQLKKWGRKKKDALINGTIGKKIR